MKNLSAFLAIKYYSGEKSKKEIEGISNALSEILIDTFVVVRDVEKYGEVDLGEDNIMQKYSFPAIDKSDFAIIEFSEKGVGLGMVAGYCCGIKKPYYIIAKTGSEISPNIGQNAKNIFFYDNYQDLEVAFSKIQHNEH